MNVQEQLKVIQQNADKIIGLEDIEKRLARGKRLRIKLGVDPTRPDLTFGHMVVFNKLRQFQDLGHECILLIGDYTATIGDPSGRSDTRPPLTPEEVKSNAKTYLEQAFLILDREKTIIRYNSEWLGKMSFGDMLMLTRSMTVARMLERDDFAKRYAENTPISIVEFLYPLIQGYDSVMLESDVELGGSDQLFNNLVGRKLQEEIGQEPQAVLTLPLIVGLDGVKKMSKSYHNYIGFNDSSKDMFGKIMSIADETMWVYYKLLLLLSDSEIAALKKEHPMQCKKDLAKRLVSRFFGDEVGKKELENFEAVFSRNEIPVDMPGFSWETLFPGKPEAKLIDILIASNQFATNSEARRALEQGSVKVNQIKETDGFSVIPKPERDIVVQAGKRKFFKIFG